MAPSMRDLEVATEGESRGTGFQGAVALATTGKRPTLNDLASFFGRIEVHQVTGCWLWRGSYNSNGYGMFRPSTGGSAHRTSYGWFVGAIQDGMQVDHLCRIRACCNPAHLELVTRSENLLRASRARVKCPNGHPWVPENWKTWTKANGATVRTCRLCTEASNARWLSRKKASV